MRCSSLLWFSVKKSLILLAGGLHAEVMVQDALADAQVFGGDFQQLVGGQEFQAALQAELADGHQAQGIVAAGSAGVGQVLGLADVDIHILAGSGVANDHALVDLFTSAHQKGAALLSIEQTVGDSLAGLKADQRTSGAVGNHASPDIVTVEDLVDDAFAVGIGQELVAVAEQAAAGHTELQTHTVGAQRFHLLQDSLALAQTGHDSTLILGGHIDDDMLHRLIGLAVDDLSQNVRGRDLQLITFTAHGLDQDGQVHLAAAAYAERVRGVGLVDAQGNVLQQLAEQALAQVARGDELALRAGEVKKMYDPEEMKKQVQAEIEAKRAEKKKKKQVKVTTDDGREQVKEVSEAELARIRLARARELDEERYKDE